MMENWPLWRFRPSFKSALPLKMCGPGTQEVLLHIHWQKGWVRRGEGWRYGTQARRGCKVPERSAELCSLRKVSWNNALTGLWNNSWILLGREVLEDSRYDELKCDNRISLRILGRSGDLDGALDARWGLEVSIGVWNRRMAGSPFGNDYVAIMEWSWRGPRESGHMICPGRPLWRGITRAGAEALDIKIKKRQILAGLGGGFPAMWSFNTVVAIMSDFQT